MKVIPITSENTFGFTHRVNITHADLTEGADNTAQTIQMIPALLGLLVLAVATRVVTPFEDVSDAAFNSTAITVGDGVDPDRFIASQQVNVNGSEVLAKAHAPTTTPYAYLEADTIDIVFNSMAAKALVNIDKGEMDVFLTCADLNKLI